MFSLQLINRIIHNYQPLTTNINHVVVFSFTIQTLQRSTQDLKKLFNDNNYYYQKIFFQCKHYTIVTAQITEILINKNNICNVINLVQNKLTSLLIIIIIIINIIINRYNIIYLYRNAP